MSAFTKDECGAAPLYSETSETVGGEKKKSAHALAWRKENAAQKKEKKKKKGEVVGHQCVNKLPHSVNQPGETGADPPVVKSL